VASGAHAAPDTAGELVVRVPIVGTDATVASAMELLKHSEVEYRGAVAVCDAGHLVGVVSAPSLIGAEASALAVTCLEQHPLVLDARADQEVAAWAAAQRSAPWLAVVGDDRSFLGLIPAERLLAVLRHEHEEDLARIGGFLRGSATARSASNEVVWRRLWHRLPWLFLGLLGAVAAADIVGAFEQRLEEHVLLAFFIPGIVYLADAVGTQTEALVIRGLSVGVGIGDIVWRELLTGVLAGLALALAFLPFGILRWGDVSVAFAVAVSLFFACSIATIVAMSLPWLLQKAGADPAFGSGPAATVIQDLLSIVVYFGVVVVIVG
jgi:magnesium transporter